MQYTLYELFWLYFLYSFLGWCAEVALAAIARKKFINRGFVTGPLCPIYGAGAVAFAIFLPELTTSPVFLFLGSMILASGIEYFTGAALEKIFHKRWWDYSNHRFHLNGYVCLRYAFVWGIFGTFSMYLGNHLLLTVVSFIPHMVGFVLLIVLGVLLGCDVLGSSLAIAGLHVKQKRIQDINTQVQKASFLLENAITVRIQSRMQKAFSGLNQPAQATTKKAAPTVFAEGCSFYKLVSLFFIGAFLGDITETIFCYVTSGVLMSRSSVVYGPFSIVWGLGCMLLTAVLYRQKDKSDGNIFIAGTLLGGAYEYLCSVFTELVFGTVFWDYSGFAFNLGGRINLLYCFFWGIAAVVWLKLIYPRLSALIEKIPVKVGPVLCNIMIVFMIFNMLISAAALSRYTARHTDADAFSNPNAITEFLDTHFTDQRMERIYPNAKIVDEKN